MDGSELELPPNSSLFAYCATRIGWSDETKEGPFTISSKNCPRFRCATSPPLTETCVSSVPARYRNVSPLCSLESGIVTKYCPHKFVGGNCSTRVLHARSPSGIDVQSWPLNTAIGLSALIMLP